jgi:hypothetical protein
MYGGDCAADVLTQFHAGRRMFFADNGEHGQNSYNLVAK